MVDKFKNEITVFTKAKEYAVFTEVTEPVNTKRGFNFWKFAVLTVALFEIIFLVVFFVLRHGFRPH